MTAFYKPPKRKRLESKPSTALRGSRSKMGGDSFTLDDSFNASPTSIAKSKKRAFTKAFTSTLPAMGD